MYTVYFEVWNLFVTRFYDQLVPLILCYSLSLDTKHGEEAKPSTDEETFQWVMGIERGFSQLHLTWMQVMASASTYLQLFFLLATLLQDIDDMLKWWTHFTFGAKLCKDNNYKNKGSPHFYVIMNQLDLY